MAKMLPTYLGGQAETIWKEMPIEDRESYRRQKKWLMKKMARHSREELRAKFYTASQKDDESAENFAHIIKDLCVKGYDIDDEEANYSKELINRFLNGANPSTQVGLATQKWRKLSLAVESATRLDTCMRRGDKVRENKRLDSDPEINMLSRKKEESTKRAPPTVRNENQRRDSGQNLGTIAQAYLYQPATNMSQTNMIPNVACHGCKQNGHMIRDCPNRR